MLQNWIANDLDVGLDVVAWEDPVVDMVVVALAKELHPTAALVAVDMVIAVVDMVVDVRVVTTVIAVAITIVEVSAASVAQWVLDVVLVVLVVLVEIAEKVVTDSDLQIAAGREKYSWRFQPSISEINL